MSEDVINDTAPLGAENIETPTGASEFFGVPMDPDAVRLFTDGGPIVYLIAALSVAAIALSIWKIIRFASIGVWGRKRARRAALLWADGQEQAALDDAALGRGPASQVVAAAMQALRDGAPEGKARERAARLAKEKLAELRVGLRGLEVIVTIAPLLGLLGTVLGMIAAFQTLQASGARADPSALAGGIWEALLTTAAGMAVAIPTGVALNYFESVIERTRVAIESAVSIVFAERKSAQEARMAGERRAESPRGLQIAE